jgi:hypothetical protein
MRVSETVNRNFDVVHAVEVRDKGRKTIDAKVSLASDRCPMHEIPDARNLSQPSPRWNEVLEPPIGRYEQGGTHLRVSIKKPFEAPERTTRKVAAGLVLIGRRCRMNVIDAETHRTLLSSGQPITAGDQSLRWRARIERATIISTH